MIYKCLFFSFLFLLLSMHVSSQYRYPLDVKPLLSANFAELRPNHFHSGIDLKTENVENKPVYSIESGYVSRISIAHSGYGLALYIKHPDGNTSVYGHLNSYASNIGEYVKNKQYILEKYCVDLWLEDDEIPVKKGQVVAYSGNTGSSFGPHVHFEIRQSGQDEALDPLLFYKKVLNDTQSPIINGVAVFSIDGEGAVNSNSQPVFQIIKKDKKGIIIPLKDTIQVWGKVGFGVQAVDKMNETHNVFGVKKVKLQCDGQEIFSSEISSFKFSQTRMINSFVDYDYWRRKKVFYMKSFVEPGNKLPLYRTVNNGVLNVDKEKVYNLKYLLEDHYGNITTYDFVVNGKRQVIIKQKECSQIMLCNENNYYVSDDFSMIIPRGYLYTDIPFILNRVEAKKYFSPIYTLHNKYVPLDNSCDITFKINRDSLTNKSQYGLVKLNEAGKESWIGGSYSDGHMIGRIRELGDRYTVSCDTKSPIITPIAPLKWAKQEQITIRITDNMSGIKLYKGTINGKFVLFEHDGKSTSYIYKFDPERLKKGQIQKLLFTASDACGNSSTYTYEFKY